MPSRFLILFIITFCGNYFSYSQLSETRLKELEEIANTIKNHDTIRIRAANEISFETRTNDIKKAKIYAELGLELAKRLNKDSWLARSHNIYGLVYWNTGEFKLSEFHFLKALEFHQKAGNKKGIAGVQNNIGSLYRDMGKYTEAVNAYLSSVKIKNEINDEKGMINTLNNIGNVYYAEKRYFLAVKYYKESLVIAEKFKEKASLSMVYSNIANIYAQADSIENAYQYDKKALQIREELGDKKGMAISYHNIAFYYRKNKRIDEALMYEQKSLALKKELSDRAGELTSHIGLAEIYGEQKDFKSAESELKAAIIIAKETGLKRNLTTAYRSLADIYFLMGEHKLAYEYLWNFTRLNDSLYNSEFSSQIAEMNARYETDKKEKEITILTKENKIREIQIRQSALEAEKRQRELELISNQKRIQELELNEKASELEKEKLTTEHQSRRMELLTKEKEIQDLNIVKQKAEIKSQKQLVVFIMVGLALAVLTTLILLNRNAIRKKANKVLQLQKEEIARQKSEVEQQKQIIEHKNKEIIDSINYASRIQKAILPKQDEFVSVFSSAFVLFKPKDIVSGDFYWFTKKENYLFWVTADCTGHGVPGGFMSMLGISLLEEIINEKNITEPCDVLDMMRLKIIMALKQKGETGENKDGMDMVLCRLDLHKKHLIYAAANNPLWLMRDGKIIEYPCDKQPVGITAGNNLQFHQHEIGLEKGDRIFTFTDGYADQFGGPKGKKFKYKKLREVIEQSSDESLASQNSKLQSEFESWKGDLEQVDDVCVIGVEI